MFENTKIFSWLLHFSLSKQTTYHRCVYNPAALRNDSIEPESAMTLVLYMVQFIHVFLIS